MTNVSGVSGEASGRAEDMLMKCQYFNEKYGANRLLMATATPVSNSMTELYIMTNYLRPDLFARAGIQNFDDWASTFGDVVTQLEPKPAGNGLRLKTRFSRFKNLPEEMALYREFADIRTAAELNLPVPKIRGGKAEVIVAEPSEFQLEYMQYLAKRAEKIQKGAVKPNEDNMLAITHEARLLGLADAAIDPSRPVNQGGKVHKCIEKVLEVYRETTPQSGVQAVFCDICVNAGDGRFSVYDYIKQALTENGIPEAEICFAGDAKTPEARRVMFDKLWRGELRVVIASTGKMGTGANFQNKLAAVHHLDIPWRPSDLEQRNGRIIRQYNSFDEVRIFHYLTERTFDLY
jgi:SNF2 family DNA or RNA helicase